MPLNQVGISKEIEIRILLQTYSQNEVGGRVRGELLNCPAWHLYVPYDFHDLHSYLLSLPRS